MLLTRRRSVVGLTLAGIAVALAVTGCSAGENRSGQSAPAPAAPQQGNADQGGAADGGVAEGGAAERNQAAVPARYKVDDRAIIFTGSVTVRVTSVDDAAAKATVIATAAGGFVGGDERRSDDQRSQATLTLRVPSGRFAGAVDELAKLGRQESRRIETEDVTEEVVDLDSKIASQQASVARTRALFTQARTISEIVSVEAELGKREAELASLQARKRTLDDLTTLSTITATLLGPDAPAGDDEEADRAGFLAGLRTGWDGFLGTLNVVLVVLGFVLPFAVLLGIPAGVTWWQLRARRRRNPAPTP